MFFGKITYRSRLSELCKNLSGSLNRLKRLISKKSTHRKINKHSSGVMNMITRITNLRGRTFSLLLFLSFCLGLSACGSPNSANDDGITSLPADQASTSTYTNTVQPDYGQSNTTGITPSPISSTTFSPLPPSGDWAISAQTASEIQKLFEFKLSKVGDVVDMSWSPDGKKLALLGSAGILVLDGETLNITDEFQTTGRNSFVSFSADNQFLAATNAITYQTQIWDLTDQTSQKIISNTGHLSAISPDGKTLVAVEDVQDYSADGSPGAMQIFLRIFDIASEKMISESVSSFSVSEWFNYSPYTTEIVFSEDGKTVQTINTLGDIRIWNVSNGQLINTSVNPYTRERLSSGYCFSNDAAGNSFAVMCVIGYMDPPCTENTPGCDPTSKLRYEIGLWDSNRLQRKRNLVIKDESFYQDAVAVIPENNSIILFTLDSMEYWNINKGELIKRVPASQTISNWFKSSLCANCRIPIIAVKPGSNGEFVAVYYQGQVIIWDSSAQSEAAHTELDLRQVTSANLGSLNNQPAVLFGLSDGSLWVVDPVNGEIKQQITEAHEDEVRNVVLGTDGKTLITSGGQTAKWWKLGSSDPFRIESFDYRSEFLANPSAGVLLMAKERFNEKNTLLDAELAIVDFYTGDTQQTMDGWVSNLSISLDGKWLATEKLNTVSLWNLDTLEWIRDFNLPTNNTYITSIALNPDSSILSVAQTNLISLVDMNTKMIISQFSTEASTNFLTFDPSGCLLAAGDQYGNVYLIDVYHQKMLSSWAAQAGKIHSLSFSQDGHLLLIHGEDGAASLWGQAGAAEVPSGSPLPLSCKASSPPLTSTPVPPTATSTPITPTPTVTQVAFYRSLSLSDPMMTGNDVYQLQMRLIEEGYTQIGIPDGIFGPKTDQAVRQYQQAKGLVVDGIVGPLTWKQLFEN